MSGAPVLDLKRNNVVGMSSTYDSDRSKDVVLAIPIESMLNVYPQLRDTNSGLASEAKGELAEKITDPDQLKEQQPEIPHHVILVAGTRWIRHRRYAAIAPTSEIGINAVTIGKGTRCNGL